MATYLDDAGSRGKEVRSSERLHISWRTNISIGVPWTPGPEHRVCKRRGRRTAPNRNNKWSEHGVASSMARLGVTVSCIQCVPLVQQVRTDGNIGISIITLDCDCLNEIMTRGTETTERNNTNPSSRPVALDSLSLYLTNAERYPLRSIAA